MKPRTQAGRREEDGRTQEIHGIKEARKQKGLNPEKNRQEENCNPEKGRREKGCHKEKGSGPQEDDIRNDGPLSAFSRVQYWPCQCTPRGAD